MNESPKNIRGYKLEGVAVLDAEIEGFDTVIVDMEKPVEAGKLVIGVRGDKPTAWRYSEADNRAEVVGRIISAYKCRPL